MKVVIDAGGRRVEIECDSTNVTPDQIADRALATWRETGSAARGTEGPAFGLNAGLAGPASQSRWLDQAPAKPVQVETHDG